MSKRSDLPPHDAAWNDSRWRSRVRSRLLDWFVDNARDLPWRRTSDPYRIWISEIMLQQTQVATVIPYYQRFTELFPTVADMAAADEQDLLKLWEGLGYYRRARSMHQAARAVVQRHNGKFPTDFDSVLALPGIGRYTAGAILSISRGKRLPILEGNTVRVFSRWVALQAPPSQTESNRLLWQIAESMLPKADQQDDRSSKSSARPDARTHGRGPGAFNQAAMELGALVCTPKNPRCDCCPVKGNCRANREGLQNEIPGKVKNIAYEDRTEFALIIASQAKREDADPDATQYLIRPLPDGGRWAGLWDFPRTLDQTFESVETATTFLSQTVGCALSPGIKLKSIKHAVTKYRITLHVHVASCPKARHKIASPWRFVSLPEMAELPMSVTGRKIANFLAKQREA